ncbi:hypothetical protein FS837_002751 [Tulasnella sp. UAMH 9824]|nr:hypothetical protein FS837_002751 [Tulasnella sp. UAMH 9824]
MNGGDKDRSTQLLYDISQPPRQQQAASTSLPTNERDRFWKHYQQEAAVYDANFLEKHNRSLDVVLIFSGLFSAVTTAFIIYLHPSLSQDPEETTQNLLKILISQHGNASAITDLPLDISTWTGPSVSAVATLTLLYISLMGCSFTVAGAMLGKYWLGQYGKDDVRGNTEEWRRSRQRKLDAIHAWHLPTVLGLLPTLLIFFLVLFGVAIITMLWDQQRFIAIVRFQIARTRHPYPTYHVVSSSPSFAESEIPETAGANYEKLTQKQGSSFRSTVVTFVRPFIWRVFGSAYSKPSSPQVFESLLRSGQPYWDAIDQERDGPSVVWLMTNSTDPYFTLISALPIVQEFRWPSSYDLTQIFQHFIFALNGMFSHGSQDFRMQLDHTKEDTAVALSKAILCLTDQLRKKLLCGAVVRLEVEVGEKLQFLLGEICDRFGIQGQFSRQPIDQVPDSLLPWATYFILQKLCNADRDNWSKRLLDQAIDVGTRTLVIRPLVPRHTIANALVAIAVALGTDETKENILMVDKSWAITPLINHTCKRVKQQLDTDDLSFSAMSNTDIVLYSRKTAEALLKLWELKTVVAIHSVSSCYMLGALTPKVVQRSRLRLGNPATWESDKEYETLWARDVEELVSGEPTAAVHGVLLPLILLPMWEEVHQDRAHFDLKFVKMAARLTIECMDVGNGRTPSNAFMTRLWAAVGGAYYKIVGEDYTSGERDAKKAVTQILDALSRHEEPVSGRNAIAVD